METTLYDRSGKPAAYIADDSEHSIYLWAGHAVAYVDGDNIYGWNGKHLGWFVGGVLYNLQGFRIGSVQEKCPYATFAEPAKYAKFAKHAKYAKDATSAPPALSASYSDDNLETFLKQGDV